MPSRNDTPYPRQTLSYLRELLHNHGIRPKNKLGQNFLIDLNLLDLIVRTADVSRSDLALEVGSGTGSLTTRLSEKAGAVVTVEIDQDFFALARETVGEAGNVQLLHMDVLKNKNELNPQVLSAVKETYRAFRCESVKLVANLPFAVATPVIANLLMEELDLNRMVVTVQWEIASRLLAKPGSKDYGALAVLVQSLAEVKLIRKLPPSVFWPRPKVDSAIVAIFPSKAKRAAIPDLKRFRNFLRDLYVHRRKNLRSALTGLPAGRRSKQEVDARLAELGIDPAARAETLTLEQHLRLCDWFG
ncbi:MAG: ribosomal RNA small subunit methyltransferase A [Gemmatales bacterium]|nr:MAG: ribosomal RNA small subunit methyltransferase A [Gemmatales bacterium]